jgi:hypothetical protein
MNACVFTCTSLQQHDVAERIKRAHTQAHKHTRFAMRICAFSEKENEGRRINKARQGRQKLKKERKRERERERESKNE